VLLALLIFRFPIEAFVSNWARLFAIPISPLTVTGLTLIENSTYFYWDKWAFSIVGLVLVANRDSLQLLNVDVYFLSIFVCAGVAYFRFAAAEPWGWSALLVSVTILFLLRMKAFKFGPIQPSMGFILASIGLISLLVLGVLIARRFPSFETLWQINHSFITRLPFEVVEEVIFRGMLWMLLKDLGWPPIRIIVFQALLFWLAHSYLMFSAPLWFWALVPVASVCLGILVWKTSSITPSTLLHSAINSLFGLL
jgi:membrane protease YdiL (CAAX protease family)